MPSFRHLFILLVAPCTYGADPLTTRTDAAARALNEWYGAGKAAGFAGVQYENRDGAHSPLPPEVYPTLPRWNPASDPATAEPDKGPAVIIRKVPTIGNSSMASAANQAGSIPRLAEMDRAGSEFLFRQYLMNNLFVYPEHQDYDGGANGVAGWGDLYPVNTPCVLISQGSSYSDMPFVKALLAMAAAMPPGVQKQLIGDRILCPTLQALFRQNTTLVVKEEDYFTGKAHPPVFSDSAIDELKMVTAAQLLTPLTIPPLAFLEVLAERTSSKGKDYFERNELNSEVVATTPAYIGRVFRSSAEVYEIKLSAKRSVDPLKRPLMFRWELLQGDPERVSIKPSEDGQEAVIRVRWHPPGLATSGIRTHRVDIGLFARSPLAVSAPAFLSISMLPNEMRFFDDHGRLSEICYQAGNPELGVPGNNADLHWLAAIETLADPSESLAAKLLRKDLTTPQRQAFAQAWEKLRKMKAALDQANADPARKTEAERISGALGKAIDESLSQTAKDMEGEKTRLRESVIVAVKNLADSPRLFLEQQEAILILAGKSPVASALPDLRAELKRLIDMGVLLEDADARFRLASGKAAASDSDRYYLRQLHLTVLSQVLLPLFLQRSPAPLFVDPRLGTVKPWRDIYRYDDKGQRTGWIRHAGGRSWRFDAEGRVLGANDQPQTATYRLDSGQWLFDPPAK